MAAIQQERLTRRKKDGEEALSNRLPIRACLDAAGVRLQDLSSIVSSFQTASPGGFGLHKPLVEPDFEEFSPHDPRHRVLSHHLAHAYGAFIESGFSDAAVVVCDLAGSSTLDGGDFDVPFSRWHQDLTTLSDSPTLLTESLSFYEAKCSQMVLAHREYAVAHNQPESFVHSVASLYDNVSRFVFGSEDAHGQLMALAAYSRTWKKGVEFTWDELVDFDGRRIQFRNDWQHRVAPADSVEKQCSLAAACQRATEMVLLNYARRAREYTSSNNLVVCGGAFLNILANTTLSESGLFHKLFVPSAPHDAGISIGCALRGASRRRSVHFSGSGRFGPVYAKDEVGHAVSRHASLVVESQIDLAGLAKSIQGGAIVARCSGRSEFGPRALGGRSLLGSPLLSHTKTRMNILKGRQEWRPVAPMVPSDRFDEFFEGPDDSPYMSFAHRVRPNLSEVFRALVHPDGTTRVQTLRREDDPDLYQLLEIFGDLTGYPVLVNTSLNGAGEPIVERPEEALRLFLRSGEIDSLVLFDSYIRRRSHDDIWNDSEFLNRTVRLSKGYTISTAIRRGSLLSHAVNEFHSMALDNDILPLVLEIGQGQGSQLAHIRERCSRSQLVSVLELISAEVIDLI